MAAKRFRLSMVNAAEDVPRLIRAYGRACGGEFALVLRPREDRGLLVLVKQPPKRAKQPAEAWLWRTDQGAAPVMPTASVPPDEAVAAAKDEQKGTPKQGPITLKGQWSGYLYCEGGTPRVELRRKLATYAVLTITSTPAKGWTWAVERTEKWFSSPSTDTGTAPTLLKAIETGLTGAMGLLGEACSQRDSRRRSAFDDAWAKTHPIRAAKEHKRDPIDRLKLKVPTTKTALKKQATAIKKDASAVQRYAAAPAPAQASVSEVVELFDAGVIPGFADLSERIHGYANGQLDTPLPVDDFLTQLRADVRKLVEEDGRSPGDEYSLEALSWVDALDAALKTAPSLLARTQGLIAYATAAADSPKCTGGAEQEARQAISQAQVAYDDARQSFIEGYERQAMRKLRQSAEWLGLSAAKISASCESGQRSLTALVDPKPRPLKRPESTPTPKMPTPKLTDSGTFVYLGASEATAGRQATHVWERRLALPVDQSGLRVTVEQTGRRWSIVRIRPPYVVVEVSEQHRYPSEAQALSAVPSFLQQLDQQMAVVRFTVPKGSSKKSEAAVRAKEAIEQALPAGLTARIGTLRRGSWDLPVSVRYADVDKLIEVFKAADQLLAAPKPRKRNTSKPRTAPPKAPRPQRAPTKPAPSTNGLTAEKNALLQNAFSSAIADVVKQLQAGA